MTTDVAVRQVELSNEQLQYIAHTEFVPTGLRGNLPAILACVATGRALGLADMTALRSIHVIDGKATFSAELMVMLVRRAGHSIEGGVREGVATVVGTRADNGDTMTVEWTMAMADRAKLLGKQNWQKYPESMLWARAASQLCRMLFPDCFAGATYTPEELEGSAGVPSADTKPVPDASPSPSVDAVAQASEDEPATPADKIAKAAEGLPPVDMSDPDIPFGDAPAPAAVSGSLTRGVPDEGWEHEPAQYITKRQRDRLWAIVTESKVAEEDVRAIVVELTGQESTAKIPRGRVYDTVITAIQGKGSA